MKITLPERLFRNCLMAGRSKDGVAAVEFGIISFSLFLLVLGMIYFGLAINSYLQLTSAAGIGAQALSLTRGVASPYSEALSAVTAAAGSLTTSEITSTMAVNGTACTAGSCTVSTAGQVASVTLTYPCNLTVMGINFAGGACNLSSTSAAIVQ